MSAETFLPRSNGVVNSVCQTSRELTELGHVVEIVCPGEGPSRVEGIRVHRVPSIAVDRIAQLDFPTVGMRSLRKIIESFKPDVIHLASPFLLGEKIARLARELGIPTVAIFQTDLSGFAAAYGINSGMARRFIDSRLRKLHSEVTITLAPSTSSLNYLNDLGVQNLKIWRRGVDTRSFSPNRKDEFLRQKWNPDANTVFVGYVGRLAPEKKIFNLSSISALRDTTEARVQLVFIGDGPSRQKLQEAFPDGVFMGKLSGKELYSAVASLDVVVTTGENETFCQVIQEAFASGVPVVAPAIGGPLDLVTPGFNGLLYPPGNRDELAHCVSELVNNADKRRLMGKNGYEEMQDRTWRQLTLDLLNHYVDASFSNAQISMVA